MARRGVSRVVRPTSGGSIRYFNNGSKDDGEGDDHSPSLTPTDKKSPSISTSEPPTIIPPDGKSPTVPLSESPSVFSSYTFSIAPETVSPQADATMCGLVTGFVAGKQLESPSSKN